MKSPRQIFPGNELPKKGSRPDRSIRNKREPGWGVWFWSQLFNSACSCLLNCANDSCSFCVRINLEQLRFCNGCAKKSENPFFIHQIWIKPVNKSILPLKWLLFPALAFFIQILSDRGFNPCANPPGHDPDGFLCLISEYETQRRLHHYAMYI